MKNHWFRLLCFGCFLLLINTSFSVALAAEGGTAVLSNVEKAGMSVSITQANIEKQNYSKTQMKISTDLLDIIDTSKFQHDSEKIDRAVEMMENNQFRASSKTVDTIQEVESGSVYVYIYLKPGVGIDNYDIYLNEITAKDDENNIIVAWVNLEKLEALAQEDGVRLIQTVYRPIVYSGSVMSEGDTVLNTDKVRSVFEQLGQSVKVGVISDGVNHYMDAVASGNLPNNVSILSDSVGGDEGTAMLEIIYDLAPSAQLFFHDCGDSFVAFNEAVDALVAAGCKIICDDIGWPQQPYFEDGIIAQHFTQVAEQSGVLFVSSAGNSSNHRHYQGLYYNDGYNCQDFSRGTSATKYLYFKLPVGASIDVFLQWDDPFGAATNDYDLYIERTDYSYVSRSIMDQAETGEPLEFARYTNNGDEEFVGIIEVYKYGGSSKTLELYVYMTGGSTYINNFTSADSIYGHAAAEKVLAVGAIHPNLPNEIANYSSQGPVTLRSGMRNKPDICGIAGVSVTGAGGFSNPFYGTSAAAPHIAALTALLWAQNPTKTAAQIRALVQTTAVDLGQAGYDFVFGYGRADAYKALFPQVADAVFAESISKTPGSVVTINSSGISANNVWLAPAGTVTFTAGDLMTKAANGTATSLPAPATPGNYKLFVLNNEGGVSVSAATLTVKAIKALTITGLSADSKAYDGTDTAVLSGTAALLGVTEGDQVTLSGTAAAKFADKNAAGGINVAVTGLSLSGRDAEFYTLTPLTLTANITKKVLTVKAENAAKLVGEANPVYAYSITGYVQGEGSANLTTQPTIACAAEQNSPAGSYDIVVSGGSADNYSFQYANGKLYILTHYLPGDADLNGVVNVFDAVTILRHEAGLTILTGNAKIAADADENGGVNVFDAVFVLRKEAGLPT